MSAEANKELIERFYEAFDKHDGDAMAACYAPGARFRFEDGLIAEHTDEFSFHRWSRQALGTPGLLLGWTPVLRGATQKKARASLDQFMAQA